MSDRYAMDDARLKRLPRCLPTDRVLFPSLLKARSHVRFHQAAAHGLPLSVVAVQRIVASSRLHPRQRVPLQQEEEIYCEIIYFRGELISRINLNFLAA